MNNEDLEAKIISAQSCLLVLKGNLSTVKDYKSALSLIQKELDILAGVKVHLIDELRSLRVELAYTRLQRDALLEITWLDSPSEPDESTAKWRERFDKEWARRDTSAKPN